jgi:hypothetical protein
MGYNLTITRLNGNKITKTEWLEFIEFETEFKLIQEVSGEMPKGNILNVPTPDAGLWEYQDRAVPFTFNANWGISVKNPDLQIIIKMISIADKLKAQVQGEDGELYDEKFLQEQIKEDSFNEKKWWQFWK